MFQALRRRLQVSPATAIATLALVFAMTGGAYAAKHYLITSTKQISPKVLKALKGKPGPAGPAGLAGAAGGVGLVGAPGKEGAAGKGTQGIEGKPGESVTNTKVEKSSTTCANQGGAEFKVGAGTPTTACNGQTGFTETLPSTKTEKGDWAFGQAAAGGVLYAPVSFNIPLEAAPVPIYIAAGGSEPTHCPGTVAAPAAEPGYLCVFAKNENRIVELAPGVFALKICSAQASAGCAYEPSQLTAADKTGFLIDALAESGGYAYGTWAVTAE
jgi:hypothetical protein